jgi:dipeptidyl-peptidase 4
MIRFIPLRQIACIAFFITVSITLNAQQKLFKWADDGNSYYVIEQNEVVRYSLPSLEKKVIINKHQLSPDGQDALNIEWYDFSADGTKVLLYTNSSRVWRINTRGDYWLLSLTDYKLKQLGASLPPSSLMFAKISPDGTKAAYVCNYNIYVEDLKSGQIEPLTKDGTRKFINGTFDWVYEEEFGCRDGFRWSPDSKSIAYWQIDATDTKDYFMINYTDSIYSSVIPVEYPKVGQAPSACRVGVVNISTAKTEWLQIPGDPKQNYIVRMEYVPGTNDLVIQQLNRKQNETKLYRTAAGQTPTVIYSEKDEAWIEVPIMGNGYTIDFTHSIEWLSGGKEFLWISERDGWQHVYRLGTDGKTQVLVTVGAFDVISTEATDVKNGYIYYTASPSNATQRYLYRSKLSGKSKPELLTPAAQTGTHQYAISPTGTYAQHTFSNTYTRPVREMISLPKHTPLNEKESIAAKQQRAEVDKTTEFFQITTEEGVQMDGWMVKPTNFDASKKYPVVFFVYTEPAGANVKDSYGSSYNFLYQGDMREDGYIYISIDNRGTPAPKGKAWRKSIYRKIGQINIRDQALAAKEILKWTFVDPERIAVWGWSGGGSATLNLMFQYPEIYKTGIAVAAVANQLTYDNIYQERFMGLPQENLEDFVKGSPITYAKNLQGNLLYIHGTGDDNVHYQNAEMLVNELIKHNKQFQFMPYPNRTHGISEGDGTFEHLSTLYTTYLKQHCPPGGR